MDRALLVGDLLSNNVLGEPVPLLRSYRFFINELQAFIVLLSLSLALDLLYSSRV